MVIVLCASVVAFRGRFARFQADIDSRLTGRTQSAQQKRLFEWAVIVASLVITGITTLYLLGYG